MIGILLAGGRARRLGGGDKGLHAVGGMTILERVIERMRPQCTSLVLNANGDATRFATLDLPVVVDAAPDHAGPLAGVLAGLDFVAARYPLEGALVTVPTDTPFLPGDLVARLGAARHAAGASIAYARSAGRAHYVAALWDLTVRDDLRAVLVGAGRSTVSAFVARHPCAFVDWPVEPFDPFFNVNTPADLDGARRIDAALSATMDRSR